MANRLQIESDVRTLLGWDVVDDLVFTNRLHRFVTQAYQRVGSECPEALVPDEVRRNLPGVYVSGSGSAITSYVSTTADPFVLEFSNSTVSSWAPVTDGSWDGIFWIEVTRQDGRLYRTQCREFWTSVVAGVNHKYVTITTPWTEGAIADRPYRLHVPYLWLRDDIEAVLIGQRFGSNGSPLTTTALGSAIYHGEWSNQNDRQFGPSTQMRRENHYQHPSPNLAPVVTPNVEGGNWGPEPYGAITYCFTYIWGYQDPQRKTPSRSFIPVFESTPSPASDAKGITGAGQTFTVTTPEIAWELNYGDAGTLRYGKSGWKKRLYRARVSTTGGTHATIESPNVYQFLTDVEDSATTFLDNGSIVPDYTLRLPETHGYYGWSPWPLPSTEDQMEWQLKVQRKPESLLNDYDSPRIVPGCIDALTFYALAYCCRHDKDTATAELYEGKAKEVLDTYRQKYANPTGMVEREAWDGGSRPRSGWPRARL